MSLIGRGATGTVYKLSNAIVVKRARQGEDEQADHANEQQFLRTLQKFSPFPYLIECFYLSPQNTFLEFLPNGSVGVLLNQHQERNSSGTEVLKVSQLLDPLDVSRWMTQLCHAVAYLENLGLAHNDIRPANLLLDAEYKLKLCDFDRGSNIGDRIAVLTEPFGRLLDVSDGEGVGTYGRAGARTETFAIGSVFYTLLHGHEPYETEVWGSDHFIVLSEKFQRKDFPELNGSGQGRIIHRCWTGKYSQVSELLVEFTDDGRQGVGSSEGSVHDCMRKSRSMECQEYLESGTVDALNRF